MKRFCVIFGFTGTNHGDFDTLEEAEKKLSELKRLSPDCDFFIKDLTKVFQ